MKPPSRNYFGRPTNPEPPPPPPVPILEYEEDGVMVKRYSAGFARNIESQPSVRPSGRRPKK